MVSLGLSTWSDNFRMMRLAEKLGFIKGAVFTEKQELLIMNITMAVLNAKK
jgi:RimJ/RimL family protein N-acetyltransferase